MLQVEIKKIVFHQKWLLLLLLSLAFYAVLCTVGGYDSSYGCRTDRNTEFYKYRCGYNGFTEHRSIPSVRELWTDFRCVLFYGNRVRTERRFTA